MDKLTEEIAIIKDKGADALERDAAWSALAARYAPLVYKTAAPFRGDPFVYEDVVAELKLALYIAACTYDSSRASFGTYAMHVMRAYAQRAYARACGTPQGRPFERTRTACSLDAIADVLEYDQTALELDAQLRDAARTIAPQFKISPEPLYVAACILLEQGKLRCASERLKNAARLVCAHVYFKFYSANVAILARNGALKSLR